MMLARVVGSLWATVKNGSLEGRTLLVLQPITPQGEARGKQIVAIDAVGAGTGETVYLCRGREAATPFLPSEVPTEATIVGIVDRIHVET